MLNKLYSLLVFVVAFVCFSSCSEEEAGGIEYSMGRVECYDDFLWNEYSPVMKKKQLKFVFEADALSEDASFKMGFFTIGEDGKTEPMGTDVAQVYVNGEPVDNNQFEVSNKVDGKYVENVTLELGVVFNPDAATGVHKWEVRTIETEKKMMEEVAVVNKDNKIVFSVEKVDKMNPLKKGLIIGAVSFIVLCILWFIISRYFIWSSTGFTKVMIDYNDGYGPKAIRMSGCYELVCTNDSKKRDSFFEKLFKGSRMYEVNDFWTSPVTIKNGARRNSIAFSGARFYDIDGEKVRREQITITNDEGNKVTIETT